MHLELVRHMRQLGESFRDGQASRDEQLGSILKELDSLRRGQKILSQHFKTIVNEVGAMIDENRLLASEFMELQHALEKTLLDLGTRRV